MMECGNLDWPMAKELVPIMMEVLTKVNGLMGNLMDKEPRLIKKRIQHMWVIGTKVWHRD